MPSAPLVQFYFLPLCILLLLPLSLPIDGADWGAQFRGWSAGDWCILVANGSLVYLGSILLLQVSSHACAPLRLCRLIGCAWTAPPSPASPPPQNATWQLGAPTVSMVYGLRLIAAIVEQRLILGATVITSGLQIGGVVVTVGAVTAWLAWQWRQAQLQSRARLRAAAVGEGG